MSLLYYRQENERHPLLHATRCSEVEAQEAIRRLWVHFAGRKYEQPQLSFTSGNRISRGGRFSIRLNVDGMNWLLVIHELAHSLDALRFHQGRQSSEARWHSKYHAKWVDRLADYVAELSWPTGGLAQEIAIRELAALRSRFLAAARKTSIDERIAHREEQVARLEKRIRALTTRTKTARRSLAALRRVKARGEQ